MIRPRRQLAAALLLALAGGALLALGAWALPGEGPGPGRVAGRLGLLLGLAGAAVALNAAAARRLLRRLERGEGLVAAWRVPAPAVAAFAAAEARRGRRRRSLWHPSPADAGGVEVRVGPDALAVGGAVVRLARRGAVRFGAPALSGRDPPCLEFPARALVGAPGGGVRRVARVLRVPVPPGAEAVAARVVRRLAAP